MNDQNIPNDSEDFGQDSFEKDDDLVDEDFNDNFKIEGQKSLIKPNPNETDFNSKNSNIVKESIENNTSPVGNNIYLLYYLILIILNNVYINVYVILLNENCLFFILRLLFLTY